MISWCVKFWIYVREYDLINFWIGEVLVIFACYTTVREKGSTILGELYKYKR